jgi:hypothetical protein
LIRDWEKELCANFFTFFGEKRIEKVRFLGDFWGFLNFSPTRGSFGFSAGGGVFFYGRKLLGGKGLGCPEKRR